MPFDAAKFNATKWAPRTEDVPVPDLKDFFPEGEPAVWRVRGLTGKELGLTNQAAEDARRMVEIIDGLTSDKPGALKEVTSELVGSGEKTPADISRRLKMLQLGSVSPVCDFELAGKLCKAFCVEFYSLTRAIERLTAAGHIPGKAPASGETPV
jgi:hypothetical protein